MNCYNDGLSSRSCSQPVYCREDAERVRKEMEKERRRMRLQQVREESKNFARKIRNNVADEKERQLRQLELAKAREMECWRQNVMAQQHHDYRSAVFQVGSAHNAAQIEKERMALRECNKANSHADFRKQLRARRSCGTPSQQLNQQPLFAKCPTGSGERNKSRSPSTKSLPLHIEGVAQRMECRTPTAKSAGATTTPYAATGSAKRKRNVGFHAKHQCNCKCANQKRGCQMTDTDDESSDSESDSYCDNSVMDNDTTCVPAPPGRSRGALKKTPAVVLDIEIDSDDSVTITAAPDEMKDKHVGHNRQFSRVVRRSPEPKSKITTKPSMKSQPKSAPLPKPKKEAKPTQPKKPTRASAPELTKKPPTPKKKAAQAPVKASTATTATPKKKTMPTSGSPKKVNVKKSSPFKKSTVPRFNEVSNLLKPTNTDDKRPPQSPGKKKLPPSPPAPNTSPRPSRSPSPERQRKSSTVSTAVQATAAPVTTTNLRSNTTVSSTIAPNTTGTTTARLANVTTSLESGGSSGSILCTGRVQFFDYKNKFTKEYAQPTSAVRVDAREPSQPNAMEQASIETGLRQAKEKEIDDLRKKADERGLKALEREQVRRDCAELENRLEAMTKQHAPAQFLAPDPSLLPPHHFVDQAARRERKMNAALEEIVLKPAIITCPVIGESLREPQQQQQPQPARFAGPTTTLNLGTLGQIDLNQSVSSESGRSMLLGYVNDQSQQLRNDLKECNGLNEQAKNAKLRELLGRIEDLRDCLIQELNKQAQANAMPTAGSSRATAPTETTTTNVQHLMESISDVRRQRDSLLQEQRKKEADANQAKLRRQKAECHANSAKFKEQMQYICKMMEKISRDEEEEKKQKDEKPPIEKESEQEPTKAPVEITIKLQDKGKPPKRSSSESKPKLPKTPRRVSSLTAVQPAQAPVSKKSRNKQRASLLKAQQRETEVRRADRQNSYDSNSTSYLSLPSKITNKLDALLPQDKSDSSSSDSETEVEPRVARRARPQDNLNPLVAQYVNRLLSMSARSVNALGVSSSEVDTPNSSIMNTSANRQPNITGKSLPQAMDVTDDRLERVQRFIEDNRTFLHDLENTMLTQYQNMDERTAHELSMQAIEEIWQQRFGGTQTQPNPTKKTAATPDAAAKPSEADIGKEGKQKKKKPLGPSNEESSKNRQVHKKRESSKQPTKAKLPAVLKAAPMAPPPSRTTLVPAQKKKPQQVVSRSVETQIRRPSAEEDANTEAQLERYNELTQNCTQRIVELTGMISKVREEKQKLLEESLSSGGTQERPSLEYAGNTSTSTTVSSKSAATTSQQPTTEMPSKSSESAAQPLDKQKATGWSRDSGISVSRPMTGLGDYPHQADGESSQSTSGPPLVTSASQHAIYHTSKSRPPPSLHRFSPQLIEDELAHELSTILEVDTPVTSRINTSIQPDNGAGRSSSSTKMGEPIAFPTFEQYAQQTNLDLTQIDPEMSMMIEHEYNELIAVLRNTEFMQEFSYREFPSLNTYLQNVSMGMDPQMSQQNLDSSPENVEMLLECLRLANVTLRSFPNRKDYTKQTGGGGGGPNISNRNDTEYNGLLNSVSLQNVSSSSSGESTLDIEAELKRRNLFKSTVHTHTTHTTTTASSRTEQDGETKFFAKVVTAESGVEKLSSSSDNLTSELEKELHGIGLAWTGSMRKKRQEAAALNSTSNSTTSSSWEKPPLELLKKTKPRPQQLDRDALELEEEQSPATHSTLLDEGRPLNLRDFLTKELLKRVNTSGSMSSGTDDSLCSQFLNSIIDSMSPRNTAVPSQTGTSANNRTDRQKTSTPVPSSSAESRSRGGGGGVGGIGQQPLLLSSSSSATATTSSSNLFSGESRLSSVQFQDFPSMHFFSTDTKETMQSGKRDTN